MRRKRSKKRTNMKILTLTIEIRFNGISWDGEVNLQSLAVTVKESYNTFSECVRARMTGNFGNMVLSPRVVSGIRKYAIHAIIII